MKKTLQMYQEEPILYKCEWDIVAPGSCWGPAFRSIYIIECCISGTGTIVINGKEFSIGPGDCYALLPGDAVKHTASLDNPRQGISCVIGGNRVGRILAKAGITSDAPFIPADAFEEVKSQMLKIMDMEEDKDPGAELRRTAYVYQILGAIHRYSSFVSENNCIQKAIGIMEAFYNEPLSVSRVAKSVGMERSYFSTLFKEQVGQSPHQYLTVLRIRKACMFMERTDYSVSFIAEIVGLDPKNFARLFKGELGMTPSEYRRSARPKTTEGYQCSGSR